uniref:FAD-binding oxidoreductase n=1 Tax=candidate division WOR-3 bacterium TaxID=2052148 RepID=A0A7C4U7G8_UNCW3
MERIVIIGSGIIGNSILYHLYELGFKGKTILIEKDEAPAQETTSLSAGAFRNIWSTEVNMKLTSFSIKKFSEAQKELGCSIGFEQRGYLFNYYKENFNKIKEFKPTLDKAGVHSELLAPEDIKKIVPGFHPEIDHLDKDVIEYFNLEPIEGALFGKDCGFLNPTALAVGYLENAKKKNPDKIEILLKTEVKKILINNGKVEGVLTDKGEKIFCDICILSAGPWSAKILEDSGVPEDLNIPVVPLKRMLFIVNPPPLEGILEIPFTIIDKGVYLKPEAMNLLIGKAKEDQKPGFDTTPEREYYEDFVNLIMQARIEGAEFCRIQRMWGGLYEHNTKDKNGIVSFHSEFENLFIATGFSGHGIMEAPAVGLSVAEKILFNEFKTIPEIKALDYKRFKENKLIVETIVI